MLRMIGEPRAIVHSYIKTLATVCVTSYIGGYYDVATSDWFRAVHT